MHVEIIGQHSRVNSQCGTLWVLVFTQVIGLAISSALISLVFFDTSYPNGCKVAFLGGLICASVVFGGVQHFACRVSIQFLCLF